jgi:parallel beta-helix repeat protein
LLLTSTQRCAWTGGVVRANGGNGFYIRGEFNDIRLTATSASGTFAAGETVTNGTGASGTVRSWNAVTSNLVLRGVTGAFTGGDTATGGTSGATLTVVAAITEPASTQNSIVGSQIHDNANNGIFFETTTESNVVDGCVFSGNNSGIRVDTSFNEITGCRLTYNVTGIQLNGGASNFVEGCHAYGNQSSGISIQNSTDNTVSSCMVRSLGIQGVGITVTSTTGYNRLINNDVYNGGRFSNITRTDTTTVLINNMEVQNALSTFQNVNSPESVVAAPVGSVYQRTDGGAGTSIYIKESGTGNTGWVAK